MTYTVNSYFKIDLGRTFIGSTHNGKGSSYFYSVDGNEFLHSSHLWLLGHQALSLVVQCDLSEVSSVCQESVNQELNAMLKNVEALRLGFMHPNPEEDFFKLISQPGGDVLPVQAIEKLAPVDFLAAVAALGERVRFPKDFRNGWKSHVALMTLYALNELVLENGLFVTDPVQVVDVYAKARNVWDGVKYIDTGANLTHSAARSAAHHRHSEHRELKQEALEYYAKNLQRFRSRAAAASEIARLLPIKERTIYKWLAEYDHNQIT